jgi:hypothetical protein
MTNQATDRRLAPKIQLTSKEAALKTGKHPETIRDACRTGELHAGQRGKSGTWNILEPCLTSWLLNEKCAHKTVTRLAA